MTPNGWGSVRPEGKTAVWLAVSSLPLNVNSIYVHFTVKCDEIGYDQSKKVTLQESRRGLYSAAPSEMIERDTLIALDQWTFECAVEILSMKSNDGRNLSMSEREERDNVALEFDDDALEFDDEEMSEPTTLEILKNANAALSVKWYIVVASDWISFDLSMYDVQQRVDELSQQQEISNAKVAALEEMVSGMRDEMRSMRVQLFVHSFIATNFDLFVIDFTDGDRPVKEFRKRCAGMSCVLLVVYLYFVDYSKQREIGQNTTGRRWATQNWLYKKALVYTLCSVTKQK